jgi:DNA-binding IclR family transcriptional regulator
MTLIRYDIIPQSGGWSIAMGGAVGPPYLELTQAVSDTEHVAALLVETGDVVDIVVWQGGEPHLLERLEPTGKHQ